MTCVNCKQTIADGLETADLQFSEGIAHLWIIDCVRATAGRCAEICKEEAAKEGDVGSTERAYWKIRKEFRISCPDSDIPTPVSLAERGE